MEGVNDMSWNHRVIKNKEGELEIHEVFYDEDGIPDMMTEKPIAPFGETLEDLIWCLKSMLAGCDDAIIDPEELWGKDEEEPDDND
jgi:hypothetical protein